MTYKELQTHKKNYKGLSEEAKDASVEEFVNSLSGQQRDALTIIMQSVQGLLMETLLQHVDFK